MRSTATIAPIHHSDTAAKIAVDATRAGKRAATAGTSVAPICRPLLSSSATISSNSMADSAVARAAGRTNSAATATSRAIQATSGVEPVGVKAAAGTGGEKLKADANGGEGGGANEQARQADELQRARRPPDHGARGKLEHRPHALHSLPNPPQSPCRAPDGRIISTGPAARMRWI